MRGEGGVVLIAVLLLSALTWALLASLFTTAWLQHRLQRAADDHMRAEHIAGAFLDEALERAHSEQVEVGRWPGEAPEAFQMGRCTLEVTAFEVTPLWWLLEVEVSVGGARLVRSGSVHVP
jgi:type II secretory pathway component PulK